jgi:hypothetical protein
MLSDNPPPTLAALVRMDWLILEHKQVIDDLRRSISQRGAEDADSVVEKTRYMQLLEEQKERMMERQIMREYLANAGLL